MVRSIRCLAIPASFVERRVVGRMTMFVFWWLSMAAALSAQQPGVHYWHQGVMPPGAIGSRQLQRGGPLPGYFQPVEIKAPPGALVSLAVDNRFDQARADARKAGMLIGAVYRLKVSNIRMAEGAEVFPTVEVVDRIYPPLGQEVRFAIPIEITEEDLKLAVAGKFVTRVVYLEDPRHALPARYDSQNHNWFEAAPGQDPLAVADGLGRPVAILRLGARLPDQGSDPMFFYGSPPFIDVPPERVAAASVPTMPKKPAPAPIKPAPKKPATQTPAPKVHNLPPPPDLASAGQAQSDEQQPAINQELPTKDSPLP
jgi:hypothetical protein